MSKEKVFIVVKTYPTISREYAELVCTAGITEDGRWIRLYPVPFRLLDEDRKYQKFSWIEVNAVRNVNDLRPESYRPDLDTLKIVEEPRKPPNGKVDWQYRCDTLFRAQKVYTNMTELIGASKNPGAWFPWLCSVRRRSIALSSRIRVANGIGRR